MSRTTLEPSTSSPDLNLSSRKTIGETFCYGACWTVAAIRLATAIMLWVVTSLKVLAQAIPLFVWVIVSAARRWPSFALMRCQRTSLQNSWSPFAECSGDREDEEPSLSGKQLDPEEPLVKPS